MAASGAQPTRECIAFGKNYKNPAQPGCFGWAPFHRETMMVAFAEQLDPIFSPKRWLTVAEASNELGVSQRVLRGWCNTYPPKIEHKREGSRGRGGAGTILIERAVVDAHNARQTFRPAPVATVVPQRRVRPALVNPHW